MERSDLRCLIVGAGSRRAELEELSRQLGLQNLVVFTGEVPHAEIRAYYQAIDLFVVPRVSDFAADHVTPLKPFEAMALGRPMIMSDRPVTAEIIGREERGLTFQTGDIKHLAERMRFALESPDQMAEMARKAREWVLRERTWKRNAQRFKALYAAVREAYQAGHRHNHV